MSLDPITCDMDDEVDAVMGQMSDRRIAKVPVIDRGALAGVVYTLRFTSARGDNGEGFELSVIAAVLFGGVSIFGGRGSMVGVLLSLLIIGVLKNALTLDDVSSETLTIVTGALLLASVLIPNLVARWRAMRDRKLIAAQSLTKPAAP